MSCPFAVTQCNDGQRVVFRGGQMARDGGSRELGLALEIGKRHPPEQVSSRGD